MIDIFKLLGGWFVGLFGSHAGREAEIMFLRHQLLVLRRSAPPRLRLRTADRLLFVWLYRLFPSLLGAAIIFKPETLVGWHRSGFRLYWRWKSRRRVGRPTVPTGIRDLVRTISRDNPLWGAPRIHGELRKLGIDLAQSTVAKYMCRRRHPPSTGWRAFLRIHTAHIAVVDLFVIPTIGFKLLYGLVILRLERRRLLWINVTAHPTAEWIAQQITEAFPWDEAPRYLIRDRDTSFGGLRAMDIRDRPISPRSPWQNGHVERLIGSIRRECLDHVVALGERHVRLLLVDYQAYYNGVRTHLSLDKDAPLRRRKDRVNSMARRPPSSIHSDGIIGRHRVLTEHNPVVAFVADLHIVSHAQCLRPFRILVKLPAAYEFIGNEQNSDDGQRTGNGTAPAIPHSTFGHRTFPSFWVKDTGGRPRAPTLH
jgi:hypothetical protein